MMKRPAAGRANIVALPREVPRQVIQSVLPISVGQVSTNSLGAPSQRMSKATQGSSARPSPQRILRLIYTPWLLVAALLLIPCALFSLWMRLTAVSLPDHAWATALLSAQWGRPVHIGAIRAEIRGLWQPVLFLQDVRTRDASENFLLEIREADLALNPLRSLLLREPRFSLLLLRGVRLHSDTPPLGLPSAEDARPGSARPELWPTEIRIDDLEMRWRLPGKSGEKRGAEQAWRARRVALWRRGHTLHARGNLEAMADAPEKLHFEAEALWHNQRRPETLRARIAIQDGGAEFWLRLLRDAGFKYLPQAGTGRVRGRLEGRWRTGRGWRANADLQSTHLELAHRGRGLTLRELHLRLSARRDAHGHERYALDLQSLRTASGDWPKTLLRVTRDPHGGLELHCDALELATAVDLLPLLPLSDERRLQLPGQLPRGRLRELRWRRSEQASATSSWSALVENLHRDGTDERLAFQGLHGRVQGAGAGGNMEFQAPRMRLLLPELYPEEPLSLDEVRGSLDWNLDTELLILQLKRVEARLGVLPLRLRGSLALDASTLGDMNLNLTLEDAPIQEFLRHLPSGTLSPELLAWLRGALPRGRVQHALLKIAGTPGAWPLPEGDFKVRLKLADGEFHFHPDWPPLTETQAELIMDTRSLQVHIQDAGLRGELKLRGHIELPEYDGNLLRVRADTQGSLEALHRLLLEAPLPTAYGKWLRTTALDGKLRLGLELELLAQHLQTWRGLLSLEDARLRLGEDREVLLEELNGDLELTQAGFSARELRGRWRGLELLLDLDYATRTPGQLNITAHGRSDVEQLRRLSAHSSSLAGLLEGGRLHGAAAWNAALRIGGLDRSAQRLETLRLRSDLRGLASDFPTPLAKESDTALHLRLDYQRRAEAEQRLEIDLGEALQLRSETRPEAGHLVTTWDLRPTELPVGKWLPVWSEWADSLPPSPRAAPSPPLRLTLKTEQLGYGPLHLGSARLHAERDALGNLRGTLAAEHADGSWELPNQPNAILLVELERLRLPPRKTTTETAETARVPPGKQVPRRPKASWKARRLPPIHLRIGELHSESTHYGGLEALFLGHHDGALLKHLRLQGKDFQLQGEAAWEGAGGADEQTRLSLELSAPEGATVLRLLRREPGIIEGGETALSLKAGWSGAPPDFSLHQAHGDLRLEVGPGSVTNIDPISLRLLGLLQFKKLFDILRLDFNELFGESGTSFQSVKGLMAFSQGVGESNLRVQADNFHLEITGRTGLTARDYDQTAVFTPYLGSGVIKGFTRPLGGLGRAIKSLLDRVLLNLPDRIDETLRQEYRITGSWDDPVVAAQRKVSGSPLPLGPPTSPGTNPRPTPAP